MNEHENVKKIPEELREPYVFDRIIFRLQGLSKGNASMKSAENLLRNLNCL